MRSMVRPATRGAAFYSGELAEKIEGAAARLPGPRPPDLDHVFMYHAPTADQIRVICHRNFGVGSDGILWGPLPSARSEFGLRIFNPDGSEAEKSGNGLRIFARYLHATGKTKKRAFTVETKGGLVSIALHLDRHGDMETYAGTKARMFARMEIHMPT